jgi:hypothetical protein
VGLNYECAPKRLLLLGRIHNPSGWHASGGLGKLEPLIQAWLAGTMDDEQFYKRYSSGYAELLPTWGPWYKVYAMLAAAAGVDVTGVAYANVAKCWQFPGYESITQRACSKAFPLEELVAIVKPHGVFLLAPQTWVARVPTATVTSVPFRYDSAPHFQIPRDRLTVAVEWVKGL